MKQSKIQGAYNHDRYIDPYSTIEQQIRADAMLLKQIDNEEQKQFEIENKRFHEYHLN